MDSLRHSRSPMRKRARGLAFPFFVAHFAASVYFVLSSMGGLAFVESGPHVTSSRLVELGAQVLPFPVLPILSLPGGDSLFVPLWAALMVNSLLWTGIASFIVSTRGRHSRAAG